MGVVAGVTPLPKQMKAAQGTFVLSNDSAIRWDGRLEAEAGLLAGDLEKLSGTRPRLVEEELKIALPSEIWIDLKPELELASGGYALKVEPGKVRVLGKDAAGVWNGTRSLLQLLPPSGDEDWKDGIVEMDGVVIVDEPRFG